MRVGDAAVMSVDLARALALTKNPPTLPVFAAPATAIEFSWADVVEEMLGLNRPVAGGVLSVGVLEAIARDFKVALSHIEVKT